MVDVTYKIRDSAGALVLDLCADEGYAVVVSSEDEQRWLRKLVASPFVDGDSEDSATLASSTRNLTVRVFGTTWAQVESRRLALRDATSERAWLLEEAVDGVSLVWRAGRADSSSSFSSVDLVNKRRLVALSIPVQPTPAVSGV
jgi:hypothetical protein